MRTNARRIRGFVAITVLLVCCASCTHADRAATDGTAGAASSVSGGGPPGGDLSGAVPSGGGVGATPAPSPSGPAGRSSSAVPIQAEGQTVGAVKPCPIASPQQVGRAFAARPAGFTTRTSALGNPVCIFTLTKALGGAHRSTVTVTTSVDPKSGRSAFAALEKDVPGHVRVAGVGDAAFYVNDTGTIQFLTGHNSVVVQAVYRVRSGTKYAARIRSQLITLSTRIARQL